MNINDLLDSFFNYFDNGYKFEKFCKILLGWLDFDEIQVTRRSGDFGIDLTCVKNEISALDLNTINYIVQAKCYNRNKKVSASEIRAFKGTTTDSSTRRIYITTSDYTSGAIYEASDSNTPVTLIDGQQLINYFMSLQDRVFDVSYHFNRNKLDDLFNELDSNRELNVIEGRITKNDVRARILRFPSEYRELFSNVSKFKLVINGTSAKFYNISSDKTYFGGVTCFYSDFISNLDFQEAKSIWKYNEDEEVIYVDIR